jgi:hypothetical protein
LLCVFPPFCPLPAAPTEVPVRSIGGATGGGDTGATESGVTDAGLPAVDCAKHNGATVLEMRSAAQTLAANGRSFLWNTTRAHNLSVGAATSALLFCRNSETLLTQRLRLTLYDFGIHRKETFR